MEGDRHIIGKAQLVNGKELGVVWIKLLFCRVQFQAAQFQCAECVAKDIQRVGTIGVYCGKADKARRVQRDDTADLLIG